MRQRVFFIVFVRLSGIILIFDRNFAREKKTLKKIDLRWLSSYTNDLTLHVRVYLLVTIQCKYNRRGGRGMDRISGLLNKPVSGWISN